MMSCIGSKPTKIVRKQPKKTQNYQKQTYNYHKTTTRRHKTTKKSDKKTTMGNKIPQGEKKQLPKDTPVPKGDTNNHKGQRSTQILNHYDENYINHKNI